MTKEPGPAHKAVLSHCIVLQGKERRLGDAPPCRGSSLPVLGRWGQLPANAECDFFPAAQTCPEETVVFLHSQLSGWSEAGRVAALGLLGALAHSDGQCHMPGTQGRGWGYWAEGRNGLKVVGERVGWWAQELLVSMPFLSSCVTIAFSPYEIAVPLDTELLPLCRGLL